MADTSEPAFPRYPGHNGMTLRDYFAGQALAGLLAHPQYLAAAREHRSPLKSVVASAYHFSDAMLLERKK